MDGLKSDRFWASTKLLSHFYIYTSKLDPPWGSPRLGRETLPPLGAPDGNEGRIERSDGFLSLLMFNGRFFGGPGEARRLSGN